MPLRVLRVEHPDGGGPGVFGDVAAMEPWHAWSAPPPGDDVDAIVLYGGSTNVVDAAHEPWLRDELDWLRSRLEDGVPVLGLCLGAQLVAAALGAQVVRSEPPEIGWTPVTLTEAGREDPVLREVGDGLTCQWHSWACELPDGAELLATSEACPQAFRVGRTWAVQFHPEVDAPTLGRWIDGFGADPDAVAMGFDPARGHADAAAHLPAWNEKGRAMFAAFLAEAAR